MRAEHDRTRPTLESEVGAGVVAAIDGSELHETSPNMALLSPLHMAGMNDRVHDCVIHGLDCRGGDFVHQCLLRVNHYSAPYLSVEVLTTS